MGPGNGRRTGAQKGGPVGTRNGAAKGARGGPEWWPCAMGERVSVSGVLRGNVRIPTFIAGFHARQGGSRRWRRPARDGRGCADHAGTCILQHVSFAFRPRACEQRAALGCRPRRAAPVVQFEKPTIHSVSRTFPNAPANGSGGIPSTHSGRRIPESASGSCFPHRFQRPVACDMRETPPHCSFQAVSGAPGGAGSRNVRLAPRFRMVFGIRGSASAQNGGSWPKRLSCCTYLT